MSSRKGDRVGAIYREEFNGPVELFGYGVYAGDAVPVEAVGWTADIARESGLLIPRIELDNGQVVYGCECWWGPEAIVRERLSGREVRYVSIAKVRAEVVGC